MHEPFGPEYVRPPQKDCPRCPCCTEELCARGSTSVMECVGLTSAECKGTVYGCPCSSPLTRGTHAWRVAQIRVTRVATEKPLPPDVEVVLRTLADGGEATDLTVLAQLRVRGFAEETEAGHVVTELGRTYLILRGDHRFVTPVEVLSVDTKTRTAEVVVVGWNIKTPVTVLLDQLIAETSLTAEALPGTFLEAEANCRAESAEDVVLTKILVAPPLPDGWMEDAPHA